MTAYFSRDRSANGIQTQQILSRARGQMTNQIRRQKVVSVANRFKNLPTTVGWNGYRGRPPPSWRTFGLKETRCVRRETDARSVTVREQIPAVYPSELIFLGAKSL